MLVLHDIKYGFKSKENNQVYQKRTKTNKGRTNEITNYFNTFFFQAQNMKKKLKRTNRPRTAGQTIERFIKMTKEGPVRYRRVLSKRVL